MQPTRLVRKLTKSEHKKWRAIEKQLQREGLGAIDANINATGWTFANPSSGEGATFVSYHSSPFSEGDRGNRQDAYASKGDAVDGLAPYISAAYRSGQSLSIGDTDLSCAVDAIRDAARPLLSFIPACKLIQDWAESGNALDASRKNGFSKTGGHEIIQAFLAWTGLPNPFGRKTSQQVQDEADPMLCHDPACPKRLGPHSRHGAVKKLSKRLSGYPSSHRAIPPKQDRQEYLKAWELKLRELKNV